MANMTTREFIKRYLGGEFESQDVKAQIEAGWYDWFCKDKSLLNKTRALGNIVSKIVDGGKVDLDKTYVWFKNNCPVGGPLYDDFRIADIETGNVLINVNVMNPWDKRYAVYGRFPEGDFWTKPYVEFGTSRELVKWLNEPFGEFDQLQKLRADIIEMSKSTPSCVRTKLEINDAALIMHVDYRLYDKAECKAAEEAVLKALASIKGFDVEKEVVESPYGGTQMTLTFRKK